MHDPDHPDDPLYLSSREAVRRLDAALGRTPDQSSECMAASLACLARRRGLDRVDHVVLSEHNENVRQGENVFVVQGRLDDPAHLRAHMKTQVAVETPAAESFRQLDALRDAMQPMPARQQQAVDDVAIEQQRVAPVRIV